MLLPDGGGGGGRQSIEDSHEVTPDNFDSSTERIPVSIARPCDLALGTHPLAQGSMSARNVTREEIL